jgi:predicted amidohydrolase
VRIALLHLAPRAGGLAYNRRLLETAIDTAADMGAEWVVTPELCLTGYDFAGVLGTDWIVAQADSGVDHFRRLAAQKKVTLFLGHPERDGRTGGLYNAVFVIAADGEILGTHRKISVIPGVEAWATSGEAPAPVWIRSLPVGILVCADAYTPHTADRLQKAGARLLVSSAAWAPRPYGPEQCWEDRTRETGLPLFVCNRTGKDQSLDFRDAESVIVKDGRRLLSFSGPDSTVILIDWNLETQTLADHMSREVFLEEG